MHGRMHPNQLALAALQSMIAAHTAPEQITEQQLLGKGQDDQARI
jgi:hypothetical protein